ncbi:Transcriptional regulatory protein, C terminal [Bizionia echini]|uniref:Transcriptional regulatory protein, C terminal n=1 Tax=Bizionia echini TaxID=649333 RepID=A0A1I4ZM85_9FLAO|nr:winged helix-turn-helix domain-containing protein [Bizionia echini]SFN51163.1 Transcriptional regulatory protein, C terminal [Bizionia echini]
MTKRFIFKISGLLIVLFSIVLLLTSNDNHALFSERVKVSLRDVGNQLLLINQDSTSLVLPVKALKNNNFQLTFENPLSFEPSQLVSIIDSAFQKAKLPNNYIVETIACEAQEVAYSFQILNNVENSIVPCSGRYLPESCYAIEVVFTDFKPQTSLKNAGFYSLLIGGCSLLFFGFYKAKEAALKPVESGNYSEIGSFYFYPEQNKLVKQTEEISLSKKECELLEIFVAHPNQIIKRDELTKKVWEDHGVFVGRSLDTYISKLRKKLQDDSSIKITNVHGVGYKLELNQT